MEKLKIVLGTTSSWKINFVKKVFNEIGIDYELKSVKTESNVSEQPLTEKETILGSINRAKNALGQNMNSDIGLGIEVGYDKNEKNNYEMFCYATIAKKDGDLVTSCSHKFPLPKFHQKALEENKNLCDYVEEYYKTDNHPATQYLAKMIDEREPFIIESVRGAILIFLKSEDF